MKKVSNKPLISIIVPVYNVEKYLRKCIDSIINQTYKNLEIILVDDGSPDNCPKICDEYAKKDKRIVVIHKKNEGVSTARNFGIKVSKGSYICFVDSDDWIDINYIEDMYNAAIGKNADYVCCGYKRIYNESVENINSNNNTLLLDKNVFVSKLLNIQNGYGFCWSKLIKKEIIKDIRFEKDIKLGEDTLFNLYLCNNINKVVILNKPLYNYVFNSNSVVRRYDKNYINNCYSSMEKIYNYIEHNYKSNIIDMYNYIAYYVMLIAVNYCYHPNNKNKFNSLKNMCCIDLFNKAIKNSNYKDLSLTRKITLFTLKNKLYIITAFICKYRQHQFNSGERK